MDPPINLSFLNFKPQPEAVPGQLLLNQFEGFRSVMWLKKMGRRWADWLTVILKGLFSQIGQRFPWETVLLSESYQTFPE